jgi:LacI family transcriptional regulator
VYQARANGVTTLDIARSAAVSRVTVSRVLNNHHNVTDTMRRRVLQAAADLGYIRRDVADRRVLRNIGFLFASIHAGEAVAGNPFWSQVLHGVEQEATAAGISVTYRSIDQRNANADALLNSVLEARMDGILLVGPASQATVRALLRAERPLVLVDNYALGEPIDAVLSDNFAGGRAAVSHLIEAGHQQIAFIGGPYVVSNHHRTNTIWSIEQRALGYWTALSEAGIQPDERLYDGDNLSTAGGYRACLRLLATHRPFTAMFCANDESAVGAIRALHEAGLSVPGDVSVVGFDDIYVAQHLTPPLTTVRVDKEAIGAWAVRRLVARALAPAAVATTTSIHVELIQRDSVAAARKTRGDD